MTSVVPTRNARSFIPPKGAQLGPLPRRSRTVLVAQYTLQPVYIPVMSVVLTALLLLLLLGSGGGGGSVERPRKLEDLPFIWPLTWWMPWRRLRFEAAGTPEEWRHHAAKALDARIAEFGGATPDPRTRHDDEITMVARDYRLIGAEGVHELAHARGWQLSWYLTSNPRHSLTLVRTQGISADDRRSSNVRAAPNR